MFKSGDKAIRVDRFKPENPKTPWIFKIRWWYLSRFPDGTIDENLNHDGLLFLYGAGTNEHEAFIDSLKDSPIDGEIKAAIENAY